MSFTQNFLKQVLGQLSPATLESPRAPRIGLDSDACRRHWARAVLQKAPPGLHPLDAGASDHPHGIVWNFAQYDGKGDGTGLQMGSRDQTRLAPACDITTIPESDASFDVTLRTEVLEHVTEPITALRKFVRLLRPGGMSIVTASFISLTHLARHHDHTRFPRYDCQHHLPPIGFDLPELTSNGNSFDLLPQEVRCPSWAAGHYTGRLLFRWELWLSRIFGRVPENLGLADLGSREFAAFGLHIIAVRRQCPAS